MQRFLVIRLSSIGDIVHALPAVAALGESYPEAKIDWVIETRHASLLEGNPFVDRVLKWDTLGWRQRAGRAETIEDILRSIITLRESHFDAAVDFQGLYKSALIARLSHARERVGFADPWMREPGAGMFYTDRVRPLQGRHVIEMNMALVEHLGARASRWQFPLPRTAEDDRYVEEQLATRGAREFIVINPGGGWKGKCWAPENYARLIRRLEGEHPWKILLTGSPSEEGLIRTILEESKSRQASYIPTSLVQLIALARGAKLVVGGDTGPVHLAAAVGTPIVALHAAADHRNTPARNGPFRKGDITLLGNAPETISRKNKNGSCLRGVSVETVVGALRQRLAKVHE